MRIEQTLKYKLSVEEVSIIERKLEEHFAVNLMSNKLMLRTIFYYGVKNDGNWVRIRMGDLTSEGEEITVLTYKKIIPIGSKEKNEAVIDVQVDDYDTAVELLQEIGLKRQSIQENRRSKYICDFNKDRYIICIDEWPWLDHIRFVTLQSLSTVERESLRTFAHSLQLSDDKIQRGGVDEVYKQELNFTITDMPEVNFKLARKVL